MKYADLHIHTNFSDGTFSPAHTVQQAVKEGLCCIAITDHDVVSGMESALVAAEQLPLELIAGVELTAEIDDCEIHILGYFIDWRAEWFQKKLEQICLVRKRRALIILEKLKAYDVNLSPEELLRQATPGSVGRLHIARLLYDKGYVGSIREAFLKYIGQNSPCYVKKFKLTPVEAIKMINALGGLAVLAHPYTLDNDALIPQFAQLGLKGLEAYYPEHNQAATRHYVDLARKYGLLVTGGSDCHGLGKDRIMLGEVKIPYDLVEELKIAADRIEK